MHAKTMFSRVVRRVAIVALATGALSLVVPRSAIAQDDPNPGSITFTGGLDVLPGTTYVFRGIVQEVDPKLTLWPYGDIGLALFSGDGGVKSAGINFGVWNSLQTGSSGSDGPSDRIHYEEDFYTTLSLGFGGGVSLGSTFTAYTSPNSMFRTVKELSFKLSVAHMAAPYALVAFELGDEDAAGADGGNPGTYFELGVGPAFTLMADGPTLTIPVKLGLSLSDYYENPLTGDDEKFGFFDIGALLTVPLKGVPSSFGAWNFHAGADVLVFGDTTKVFNTNPDGESKKSKVVGLFGIGVTY